MSEEMIWHMELRKMQCTVCKVVPMDAMKVNSSIHYQPATVNFMPQFTLWERGPIPIE